MNKWYKVKPRGITNFFRQECKDDKSLKRSRVIRGLLLVLLIVDVVVTSKAFVLYGCVGGAFLLVGIIALNTSIVGRKKAIKDGYLKH